MRLFLFSLGGEWFALRGEQVRGVLSRGGAPRGLARLRVPGAAPAAAETSLLLVACPGGTEALLEVDRVAGLLEVREGAVRRVPAFVFPEAAVAVSAVLEWDGGLAALLEPAGLELQAAGSLPE